MTSSSRGNRRVLWASTSTTTRGGIATFVSNMQSTSLWENWDVHHIATHRDGTTFDRICIFISSTLRYLHQLVFHRPALVHLHTSSYGSFARKCILSWVATALRIPTIVHVHGSEFHLFYEHARAPVKAIIRATLRRARFVVALGETWSVRLRRIEPQARVIVIPNAVKLGAAVDQSAAEFKGVRVVFLGRVSDRKGTFLLLRAWATMIESMPPPHPKLTIAGDGEIGRAKMQVAQMGIHDSVDIVGWISSEDAQELLTRTHILVLPSLNEGQPMAILEAMTNGICVVASKSGGIPELLGEASGILVEPLDAENLACALKLVVQNHDVRDRLGRLAHSRVDEHFNIDKICRELDHLYQSISN